MLSHLKFRILSLILFLFITCFHSTAQTEINLGAKMGITRLMAEIPAGSFQFVNEFDHHIGFSGSGELSVLLNKNIETGTDIGLSVLSGNTYTPVFSAEGAQAGIPADITEPVKYQNVLVNFSFFGRYYFKPVNGKASFIPFAGFGGSYLSYYSTLGYIESGKIIFGKGTGNNTKLSTPELFLETGFRTPLSGKSYMLTSLDLNFVHYDFLDVMHNFDEAGERQKMTGFYIKVKAGFFLNLSGSSKKSKKTGGKTTAKNISKPPYLPFR